MSHPSGYASSPYGHSYGPVPTAPPGAYPMPGQYRPVYTPVRNIGRIALWAGTALVFMFCGLVSLGLISYNPQQDPVTTIVGLLLGVGFALVPVPVIVLCAVWLARFQPQPWGARIFAFGWGAAIASLIALIGNTGFSLIAVARGTEETTAGTLTAVISAPLFEESTKAAAILLIFGFSRLTFKHPMFANAPRFFNGPIDGVVYAMFVGAGFAFTENISYLSNAFSKGSAIEDGGGAMLGIIAMLVTFVLRCVALPFGHPLFTSATGIGVGIAARKNIHIAIRILAPIGGLLLAMAMHSLFNLIATFVPQLVANATGDPRSLGAFILAQVASVGAVFPMFLVGVGVVLFLRFRQFKDIRRGLIQYAQAGWLKESEIDWLDSLGGRSKANRWAKDTAGAEGLAAMKEYQFAATRLSVLRDAANQGAVSATFGEQERALLTAISQHRKFFGSRPGGPVAGGPAPGAYGQGYGQPASAPPAYNATTSMPAYGQPSAPPNYGPASAPPNYGPASAPPNYGPTSGPPSYGSPSPRPQDGQSPYEKGQPPHGG